MLKQNEMCVTVVTPTWQRHKNLITCIEQVKNQDFKKPYEHIIVSDGPDEEVEVICSYYNIKFKCIERNKSTDNSKGHLARDEGIKMASGTFIVLWDDDNIYFNHALSTLYATTKHYDIGICDIYFQMRHPDTKSTFPREKDTNKIYCTIPTNWLGSFKLRDIDTMNVIVKKNKAITAKWSECEEYEGDFYWLESLEKMGAKINYLKTHIGIKLL